MKEPGKLWQFLDRMVLLLFWPWLNPEVGVPALFIIGFIILIIMRIVHGPY